MVLVGIKAGSQTVHVRVDDLEVREREQVHTMVRLIKRLSKRNRLAFIGGLITVFLIAIAMEIAGVVSDWMFTQLHFVGFVGAVVIVCGITGLVVEWRFIDRWDAADCAALENSFKHSQRCYDLFMAYCQANPSFVKLLQGRVLLPSAAPST